jgi:eukaryotic-like serine/threonine-protein kinase
MIMNLRVVILTATLFAITEICNAQKSSEVYTQNKEANSYYVRALAYIQIGNPRIGGSVDSLLIAIECLEKAVKSDPLFVTAYIELCKTYWLFDFSYPNFPEYNSSAIVILPKAKAAINKALQVDSTSSEAYSQLGRMNKNYEYKWEDALKNYAKAIQYDSTNASNYAYYGETLALKGQWKEAQEWIDKANKMAPTDDRVLFTTGIFYHWMRNYKKADYYLSRINPPNDNSKFFSALNYVADNNPAKAIEALKTQSPCYANGGAKALMAYALIKNGQIQEAKEILKKIEELNQVVEYRSAVCYVALGEYDRAFELLDAYLNRQGNWMTWFKYDKAWDPVRTDKRYKDLLNRMPFDR